MANEAWLYLCEDGSCRRRAVRRHGRITGGGITKETVCWRRKNLLFWWLVKNYPMSCITNLITTILHLTQPITVETKPITGSGGRAGGLETFQIQHWIIPKSHWGQYLCWMRGQGLLTDWAARFSRLSIRRFSLAVFPQAEIKTLREGMGRESFEVDVIESRKFFDWKVSIRCSMSHLRVGYGVTVVGLPNTDVLLWASKDLRLGRK